MQAATDLLVEGGPNAMTVDAVVARSGVAKSTVYRHWATRDDLVNDVFHHCAPLLDLPADDEPFEQALRTLACSLVDMLSDPSWKRLMPAIMLLSGHKTPKQAMQYYAEDNALENPSADLFDEARSIAPPR